MVLGSEVEVSAAGNDTKNQVSTTPQRLIREYRVGLARSRGVVPKVEWWGIECGETVVVAYGTGQSSHCGKCPMSALERTRRHVESLGPKHALGVLDNTLETARIKQMTHREILEQLLGAEAEVCRERYHSWELAGLSGTAYSTNTIAVPTWTRLSFRWA